MQQDSSRKLACSIRPAGHQDRRLARRARRAQKAPGQYGPEAQDIYPVDATMGASRLIRHLATGRSFGWCRQATSTSPAMRPLAFPAGPALVHGPGGRIRRPV